MKPVIHLHALTKNFGSRIAVNEVSFDVQEGEVFGFLGPNGAGKTTTIRLLLGQYGAHSGSAMLFGLDAFKDRKEIHKRIGFLSGDMAYDDTLTGLQYLRYMARLRGGNGSQLIAPLAHRLDADVHTKLRKLSRGSRQKIGLIAAVMHEPDLLILDEPSSGFDPLIQAEFNKMVLEHKKKGKTVLISSHILSEVRHLCDRVAFIREGELIKVGDMAELADTTLKKVRIIFQDEHDVDHLRAIKGVHHAVSDGRHLEFQYGGHMSDLIKKLAHLSVMDMAIEDVDLEELFMEYYRGAK